MTWRPAAPVINVLLPIQIESKTHDGGLPNPGAAALLSHFNF